MFEKTGIASREMVMGVFPSIERTGMGADAGADLGLSPWTKPDPARRSLSADVRPAHAGLKGGVTTSNDRCRPYPPTDGRTALPPPCL